MRYRLLVVGFMACLLAGCGESAQPKASRGSSRNSSNAARPAAIGAQADPRAVPTPGTVLETGGMVRLDAITLTAPATWSRAQPRSTFIVAEFGLAKAEGDAADGRLTVSTAGGSIEANIDRWKGQFSGAAKPPTEEKLDTAVGKVTVVDLAGEFNDQAGPFAPAAKRSGYRMIAAIIPINGELHFIKAVGPEKTIAAHAEEIKAFVRSAQKNG